jgi:hypothetical protein
MAFWGKKFARYFILISEWFHGADPIGARIIMAAADEADRIRDRRERLPDAVVI